MKEIMLKKGHKRRMLSVFLALGLVLGMMPAMSMTAYAAGEVLAEKMIAAGTTKVGTYYVKNGTDYNVQSASYSNGNWLGTPNNGIEIRATGSKDIAKVVFTQNTGFARNDASKFTISVSGANLSIGLDRKITVTNINANSFSISCSDSIYLTSVDIYCNPHICGSLTPKAEKAAACTEDGWKAYYECSCGKVYAANNTSGTAYGSADAWKTGAGKVVQPGHSWDYHASGAKLTAACNRNSAHTATLTLAASSPNYSGSAAMITVGTSNEQAAWMAAGLAVPAEVSYETSTGTSLGTTAPTAVGSYTAKVSPVGVTASAANTAKVSFTIGQAHGADTSRYEKDDANHWNPCLRSDCTDTGHQYNKAAHNYDSVTHLCVCGKIDPTCHEHVLGTKHEAVGGNCVEKGTLEYYDCSGTLGGACGKKLDAFGNVISSIEGTIDPANHKGTATTWTKTEATHKETYNCCGAVKTAEASHTPSGPATEQKAEVCTVCGYEITPRIYYEIIEGANGMWTSNGSAGLTVRSNAAFDQFVGVKVDKVGENDPFIDSKYYKAVSGSTVVTLTPEYLNTLAPGDHTVKIVSSDGSASTTITIRRLNVPQTGDNSHPLAWLLLLAASVFVAVNALRKKTA